MSRYVIYTEVFPSEGTGIVRQTGVGRYCCELATGLAETGHDVTVITNEAQGLGIEADRVGFAVERVGSAPVGVVPVLRRAREVRRAIARQRPDCVIAGDVLAHKVLGTAGLPPATRVLPVLYGSELRSFQGVFADRGRWLTRRLRQEFLRRYFAGAFGAICISEFAARELDKLPIRQALPAIVYPAVRPLVLTRRPDPSFQLRATGDGRGERLLRLLTIGRISERKNQLHVLHALVHLRDRAGITCEYYILGNVDADVHSAYYRAMQAFISEHRLERQVFLMPGASDEEKVDCIDACDIVVAVSRTAGISTEGFGISAIEGSARGKPVIVSREGGMPETIIEGVTGFSVCAETTGQLTQALGALAASPDLRRRMGEAGREFVLQRFTPRRMAESLTSWVERKLYDTAPAALRPSESVQ